MADIDKLSVQITSDSSSAVSGIDALAASLDKLRSATRGGLGLSSVSKNLSSLKTSLSGIGNISGQISGLDRAIQTLSNLGKIKISSSVGNQITKIGTALSNLNIGDGANKITALVSALKPLETLGKSSLGSTVNALNKLPEALKKIDTRQLYNQIQSLTRIFKPLADEMQKVANGFNAFPSRIQRIIAENQRLTQSNTQTGASYINLWAKMRMAYNSVRTGARLIGSAITKMNDYIENVNLFNVSMGEYAKEARDYAEQVGEVMGIDPGEWMRNQGVFMTLATGFGVVSDRAYTMSKNLTQLGYDLSSFFNISYEDAMEKLQSGLAGELEPLRRIGYDLSQARLQQEAYTLGITKKVSAMTQAEKAELRYYAIMNQVTTAQGDMARTLSAPANQLRVLSAQFTQAARAIGSIFIPALNAVLPYIIAVAKVIRILASAVASLFGFEMPEVDYSGVGSLAIGAENAADALGGAADNAKKLQKYTMGFDELNVIDPSSGSGGSGAGNVGVGGGGFDFELPEYDFISDAVDSEIDKIMEKISPALETIKEHMDDIFQVVGSIGAGVIAWNLTGIAKSLLQAIKEKKIDKVKLGISFLVSGITLGLANGYEIGKEGLSWERLITQALATALMIGGSLLTFGTGPLGWTIGIVTALVINVASISFGKHQAALEDDLAKRFGEYVLSDTEIDAWVQKLTTNDLSVELDLFVNEQDAVTKTKTQVENAINKLNGYNFRVMCGLEVSQSEYETAIDSYIESAQAYIEQKQVVAALAIDILIGGTNTGDRLSSFVNEFYALNSGKLSELGNKLRTTVSEGFVDGEWIPDKLQAAIDLQKEMQEILDYIATVEFDAKMTALKLDASETEITAKSFETLLEKANAEVQSQMENLEAVRLEGLKIAKMEFDQNILAGMSKTEAQKIYDTTVTEIEGKFQQGKVDLTYGTFDFGMEVIKSKYSEEVSKTVPFLQQTTQELFVQGSMAVLPEDTYKNVDNLMYQLSTAYESGLASLDISDAARENIGKLLEQLKPSEEQFNEVVSNAMATGKAVPENVKKGLSDLNQLKAIKGDVRAMNYLIGEQLSKDKSFLDLLATSEGAGKSINEEVSKGLYSNITIVEDAAKGTITLMSDTIGEQVYSVTPELVENLTDLGYNLSDGLLKGAEDELERDKKKWYDAWWNPFSWFKDANEIHSPSKLFERGGADIAKGLFNGVDTNTNQTDYDGVFGRLKNWFNTLFGTENGNSSVFRTLGSYISGGLFGGIDSGVVQTSYETIFNRIKLALDKITSPIKQTINGIIGLVESMANKVIQGINGMIRGLNGLKFTIPSWVPGLGGNSFGLSIPTLQSIYIPRLMADGGFVDTGQLFIAREAGAEMVGNIGRKTAVANNDQIVAGIASGVATANSESNALLREQNALLREMLAKESGVYLDGKSITKSVEKHQRERGKVLVTGGAY